MLDNQLGDESRVAKRIAALLLPSTVYEVTRLHTYIMYDLLTDKR